MSIRNRISLVVIGLFWVSTAVAADLPTRVRGDVIIYGGPELLSKVAGDTIDLMGPSGSGAPYLGDFEAGWNGWTTVDVTKPTQTNWQVSDYNQSVAGNLAAWCGDLAIPSCNDSLDAAGGYGNNWHDLLSYRATVANPAASATVTIDATLQNDSEPGYDFTYLSAMLEGTLGFTNLQSWDGKFDVAVSNGLTYLPSELVDGTDVYVMFRFKSDGGWSDEDCSWPTAGACQVDDITVTVSQAGQLDIVSFTDFQDGTFGAWFADFPTGVGNFAQLWIGLADIDRCGTNFTQQAAFIDDGIVVPGTGGTDCINWCYGPSGYIVNTTGGLAGPSAHIQVDLLSPVMPWPNNGSDGIIFAFDSYIHEDLSFDSPGIFASWSVRSADTDDSAGNGIQVISEQEWQDRNFVYYGSPGYRRDIYDVSGLMNSGRDEIQLRLGVYELGWAWGYIGNDGFPAPYFDNVAVKVFPQVGPAMNAREIDLAQDNFPEVDAINLADLGSMHVRFDAANNRSLSAHLRNDPADTLVIDIVPVRTGASLAGSPELHYVIDANPVFDAYRTTATSGVKLGDPAMTPTGFNDDQWQFDLPDTGMLFPGDVLHYYFRAGDDVAGDVQYSTLPADITGFGDFTNPLAYHTSFVVHALPSISDDGFGGYNLPAVLFWNDYANRGGEIEWYHAWRNLGIEFGYDCDIYYTNGPSSGVGNGLGGRTSGLALEYYTDLFYTAGNLGAVTLSNGDFNNDAGDDIGALLNWLSAGNKDIFLTGDNLASDLGINAGASGLAFLESVMGLDVTTSDVRSFIGNQTTPLILTVPGNPVITNVNSWIAYGGCPGINTFDGVTVRAGAARLAEFTDPNGDPGAYAFSAATANVYNTTNRVVSLPYDLMNIYTNPNKAGAPLADRTQILSDVLDYFGIAVSALPTPVPDAARFAVANYPNPFNPATKISYVVPRAGHLSLKVFNVRGELMRTLIDGQVEGSGEVMWDGTNNQGREVSSGVYFYEARLGGEVQVHKMALIK